MYSFGSTKNPAPMAIKKGDTTAMNYYIIIRRQVSGINWKSMEGFVRIKVQKFIKSSRKTHALHGDEWQAGHREGLSHR